MTFSCLSSSDGASLPLKFSLDTDRLAEFDLLVLAGGDSAEVEFETEGFEALLGVVDLTLEVEAAAKQRAGHKTV